MAVANYLSRPRLARRRSTFEADHFTLFSSRDSVGGGPYVAEATYPPWTEAVADDCARLISKLLSSLVAAELRRESAAIAVQPVASKDLRRLDRDLRQSEKLRRASPQRRTISSTCPHRPRRRRRCAAPQVRIVLAAQEPRRGAAAPVFKPQPPSRATSAIALGPVHGEGAGGRRSKRPFESAGRAEGAAESRASSTRSATRRPSIMWCSARAAALDLKGLAAALRFIDAAQGRQGTPTALVGARHDAGRAGARRRPPRRRSSQPRQPNSVTPLDRQPDHRQGARRRWRRRRLRSPRSVARISRRSQAWRLGPRRRSLVRAAPVRRAPTTSTVRSISSNRNGRGDPKPVTLPRPVRHWRRDQAENVVVNFGFDPKTMEPELRSTKAAGSAIAGSSCDSWLWNGRGVRAAATPSLPRRLSQARCPTTGQASMRRIASKVSARTARKRRLPLRRSRSPQPPA